MSTGAEFRGPEQDTPAGERPKGKPRGRPFPKGRSPNPGGQPRALRDVRDLARSHTAHAIKRLAAMLDHKDGRVVVAAALVLLDRGWGKPAQVVTGALAIGVAPVDVEQLRAELFARVVAITGSEPPALPAVAVDVTPPHDSPTDSQVGASPGANAPDPGPVGSSERRGTA